MKTKILISILLITGTAFAQRPTGNFTLGTVETDSCQPGWTCYNFTVASPQIIEARAVRGFLGDWQPVGNPRGTILFFGGHAGGSWWDSTSLSQAFLQQLHDDGYRLVEVRWRDNGWPDPECLGLGFVAFAERPATLIRWVHDNWYCQTVNGQIQCPPSRGVGLVGYGVVGGSEGAAAIGWSLVNYGIGTYVDFISLSGGPPMADLSDGCNEVAGYGYLVPEETALMDQPWGFAVGHQPPECGPCCQHDSTWSQTWVQNSVEYGATVYPTTRIQFIEGGRDELTLRNHGFKFYQKLNQNGQLPAMLGWTLIPTQPHEIQQSQEGLDLLLSLIEQ